MSLFRKNISKATWAKLIALVLVIIAAIAYTIWDVLAGGPLTSLLSNRDQVIDFVNKMGFWGPAAYIALQVLQIIFAPIPAQVVGSVGGFIFGWWGILWTLIGNTIGYIIVVIISRKFGRSLVEKIFKKETMDKFDFVLGENAAILLFIIFLLPGLPDDMVGYMAGLTDVPLKQLVALMVLGHIPTIAVTNYIGMGLGESNLTPVIIVAILVVVLFAVALWKKDWIIEKLSKKPNEEQ